MKSETLQKYLPALTVVFFLMAIWLVVFPVRDYDTFWHLANGKAMLEQGRVINEEIFSYSAFGTPFPNHSWLAQIVLALFYKIGGVNGLILFKVVLTVLICWVIYSTTRLLGVAPWLAAFSGFAVVLTGLSRFVVRPQLFTYLFFAILIWLLYGYLKGRFHGRVLVVLPIMFVIWEFMHGAIFGFVFWGALALGETAKLVVKGKFRQWQSPYLADRGAVLLIWIWLLATAVLVLFLPSGFERYKNWFTSFWSDNNFIVGMTGEFLPTGWDLLFRPFWIALGVTLLVVIVLNLKRLDFSHLIVLMPFIYLGLRFNRCVAVCMVVAIPLCMHYANRLWDSMPAEGITRKVGLVAMVFLVVLSLGWSVQIKGLPAHAGELDPSGVRTGLGMNNAFLPMGAVEFIKTANLQGNMYNNDRWGGLLAFYLYPERRIFHYNHPLVFKDIYGYLHNPGTRDQWQHNYALIATADEFNMFRRMKWVIVYRDSVSMVLVPPNEQNRAVINRFAVRYFNPLMPSDQIRQMFRQPAVAMILLNEMNNYLKFNQDPRIESLLDEGRSLHQQPAGQ